MNPPASNSEGARNELLNGEIRGPAAPTHVATGGARSCVANAPSARSLTTHKLKGMRRYAQ